MKFFTRLLVFMVATSLILSNLAQANETKQTQCVEREVVLVIKSTRNVHYSEKDEGKLIKIVKIQDCGSTLVLDRDKAIPVPPNYCPPTVQDCIKP